MFVIKVDFVLAELSRILGVCSDILSNDLIFSRYFKCVQRYIEKNTLAFIVILFIRVYTMSTIEQVLHSQPSTSDYKLSILTCYFNLNKNPWMEENTRFCIQQWKEAGAHVVCVELARDEQFVFNDMDQSRLFDVLLQVPVHDIMWYKEMAHELALSHVPKNIPYIGWFDCDVFVAPLNNKTTTSDWWINAIVHSFEHAPHVHIIQPFSSLIQTTESTRNGCLGINGVAMSTHMVIQKCEMMNRIKKGILAQPDNGTTGTAWVMRAKHLHACGFFVYAIVGGGNDVMMNIWQGAKDHFWLPVIDNHLQKYYFQKDYIYSTYIQNYRKKCQRSFGLHAQCACLPITFVHLFHGELESKHTANQRYKLLKNNNIQPSRNIEPIPSWSPIMRWCKLHVTKHTSLNQSIMQSLERCQSVRDKVLIRAERTKKCLLKMKTLTTHVLDNTVKQKEEQQLACTSLQAKIKKCMNMIQNVDL